jgi:hypothetical protein
MMARLDPLLEVQDLDLQADRLGEQRVGLPERQALTACVAEIANNDRLQAGARERRDDLARREREVAGEVSTVAAGAKDVEGRLYSGEVTAPKELGALQEELRLAREKQTGLEERELEIMEEVEEQEGDLRRLADLRSAADTRSEALRAAIGDAEKKIDAELEVLAARRETPLATLPAEFVETYTTLRGKPKFAGKAAVPLRAGLCEGCRVSLPRVDLSRMMAEPDEALIRCPHCTRLLVR